jgi:hypothetical protein
MPLCGGKLASGRRVVGFAAFGFVFAVAADFFAVGFFVVGFAFSLAMMVSFFGVVIVIDCHVWFL